MRHLNNLYKQHDIAWFTPVELFKVRSRFECIGSSNAYVRDF